MSIHGNYIAGHWVESDAASDNINPSNTDDVVGRYSTATTAQVDAAVRAARKAALS